MAAIDTRTASRDSLYLKAELQFGEGQLLHSAKVRNLSATGMMVEGGVDAESGEKLSISLRNIGWVSGIVAWVHDGRFGVELDERIDPTEVRGAIRDDGSGGRRAEERRQGGAALRKI